MEINASWCLITPNRAKIKGNADSQVQEARIKRMKAARKDSLGYVCFM